MIPNFALIAESTEIHPRVTSIAGYYINPLARSSIVHTDGSTVSATGDSGLFRAGFSNDPLAIFGNVISGKILTERSVSAGITSTDATKNGVENVSFDLGLSANPPPILRKK